MKKMYNKPYSFVITASCGKKILNEQGPLISSKNADKDAIVLGKQRSLFDEEKEDEQYLKVYKHVSLWND